MRPTACPISDTPAQEQPKKGDKREIISSRAGERYAISGRVEAMLAHRPLDDRERELLTDWIAGEHREGKKCPLISSYVLVAVIGKG
jgi:hypothetical protein